MPINYVPKVTCCYVRSQSNKWPDNIIDRPRDFVLTQILDLRSNYTLKKVQHLNPEVTIYYCVQVVLSQIPETVFLLIFQIYCQKFEKGYHIFLVFSWTKRKCFLSYCPFIGKNMFPLSTSRTRVHLRRTWDRSKSLNGFSQHFTSSASVPFRGARNGP